MKFRRRPQVVDAEQWFPGREVAGVILEAQKEGEAHAFVLTARGKVQVKPGDWIVQDGQVVFPVNGLLFNKVYEACSREAKA